jgi:hypothetical protein
VKDSLKPWSHLKWAGQPLPYDQHDYNLKQIEAGAGIGSLLTVVDAVPTILQVDWDYPDLNDKAFEYRLNFVNDLIPITKQDALPRWWKTKSRSGRWHAYVQLYKACSAEDRVMYQLMLGSDPKREMFNLMRIRAGHKRPIVFFELRNPE